MPANHKVSFAGQIAALFVPIANFWAFYRVRKLRRYLVLVFAPSVVLASVFMIYIDAVNRTDDMVSIDYDSDRTLAYAITIGVSAGLQALATYLVIIWSRQHNRHFDSPAKPHSS
jgi:hypothetical protein